MDIASWAVEHGHRQLPDSRDCHQWFATRPDLAELVRQGRADGWKWTTIAGYLREMQGCPYSDSSIRAAAHRLGVS